MPLSAKESESVVAPAPVSVVPEESDGGEKPGEPSREPQMTSTESPTTVSLENSATGFEKPVCTNIAVDRSVCL